MKGRLDLVSGRRTEIWDTLVKVFIITVVMAMFTIGKAESAFAAKSVDGYKQAWSISFGDPGTYYILETFADGSLIYAIRGLNSVEEFGRVGSNGKIVWKRNDFLYSYSSSVTENAIMASVHPPDSNYRKDTIITIDKNTGKTINKFLLNSVGVEYLEKYSVDNERLYISDENKLLAVNYKGKKEWELTTHSELYKATNIPIGYHQPVIINDNLILTWTTCSMSEMCSWLGDDSYQLTALSPKTGKVIWSVPERVGNVTLDHRNEQIVLDSNDGSTVAYRYSDGKKLWSYQWNDKSSFYIGQDIGIEDPDGKIYLNVINENNGVYSTSRFISLNADGSVAWETGFNTGTIVNLRGISQDKKILYFESNSRNSKMYLVDRHTGKRLSKEKYDLEYPTKNGHVSIELTNSTNGFNRATLLTGNGAKIGRIDYQESENLIVGPDYRVYVVSQNKITCFAPQKQAVSVAVNGQFPAMPQAAVIQNGYTYVPVRGILEQSGATLKWDGTAQKVTIKKNDLSMELKINSSNAVVNGKTVQIEAPAIIMGNSTMLPLRFLVETLEGQVIWDKDTRTVWINT